MSIRSVGSLLSLVHSWLGFDGTDSVSALSFRNLSARFPIFSFSLEENVSAMMDELLPIYSADGNDFSVISYLYRFFSLINPDFKLDHEKNASFEHMITYIKDNLQSDISIVKMADYFNISTSQLFRDFKKYSSMSPQQYIKQYRVFLRGAFAFHNRFNNKSNFDAFGLQRYL